MGTLVTVFKSSDTGAPTLSGTAGDLTSVLSHCLIIGKVFRTADDAAFVDNTTEARTSISGQTPFTLFPTPGTSDRTYFGHSVRFTSLTFAFGTLGTSATYVWEYWNGSAWTTLSVTDGTSSFTANGTVTWTSPGGSWVTNSVNSVSMFWVRVRFTGSNPATNPTVNYVSYLTWLEVQSGSNQRDYQQGTGSNGFILSVNDNTPSVANEARVKCFETSTGLGTGTNQFPLAATQGVGGNTGYLIMRKSSAASAATRTWICIADQRTFYFFVLTTDSAGIYTTTIFGEFYSLISSDPGRCCLIGRFVEGSASMTSSQEVASGHISVNNATNLSGHYIPRDVQGSFSSIAFGKIGDFAIVAANAATVFGNQGLLAFPNSADSIIYLAPMWVHHTSIAANQCFRGRMRGMYHWGHLISAAADGDTITGTGDLAGKSFLVIKSSTITDLFIMETSDTWETN